MFIYADESGHSGRYIFNEPKFYLQGAILSTNNPEFLLEAVARKYMQELGVTRLHGNELRLDQVERIVSAFAVLLSGYTWEFHVTIIEKPYLAVTKFVDSLFDSGENRGVRWLWYNQEYFRHTLCILFDEVLDLEKKKEFWDAYLKDDHPTISSIVEWVLQKFDSFPMNHRLRQVTTDGLSFAIKYPEEITLTANETKKSYKGHTPNMVGFSNIIPAIHRFCEENGVTPTAFVHDSQSEFKSTMKEYHKLYSKVRPIRDDQSGLMGRSEPVKYDFGKFSVASSMDSIGLQACDLFLRLFQNVDLIKSIGLREELLDKTVPFYISRFSSEMIVLGWLHRLADSTLSEEQLRMGREIGEEMENAYFKHRDEFESRRQS